MKTGKRLQKKLKKFPTSICQVDVLQGVLDTVINVVGDSSTAEEVKTLLLLFLKSLIPKIINKKSRLF